MGWHQVQARSPDRSDTAALVITPAYLGVPDQLGRLWGLAVQLYAVRSHRSWGLGDAADLADLAGWSGRELGAGFVLVNPLHAADPIAPMEPSPYLPSSRRFLNPMYIRVEEVPEFGYLSLDDRTAIEQLARPCRSRNGTDDLLDRDAIWAAKKAALELVFAVSGPRAAKRPMSPSERSTARGWSISPPGVRWPNVTAAVAGLAGGAAGRTLPGAGGRPYGAGRAGGLLRLAPVGRRRSAGAHTGWPGLPACRSVSSTIWPSACPRRGRRVGAAARSRVRRHGRRTRRRLQPAGPGLEAAALASAAPRRGGLPAVPRHGPDHPASRRRTARRPRGRTVPLVVGSGGFAPADGTYVRYDHEALVGILALEAYRAGAVIVGEDLGTVEPWVRDYLRDRASSEPRSCGSNATGTPAAASSIRAGGVSCAWPR